MTAAALPPDAHVEIAATPEAASPAGGPGAFAEAPPPRPRHRGVVLESTLGVLGFAGQFRHVSPPAFYLRSQLGYEPLDWLMLFGEGDLAFGQTSEAQDESQAIAFPIWGFGGGARATLHATPRVALFFEAQVGAMAAGVPHDALTILGFRDAEHLAPSYGVRAGVEWYQIDRHMALTAQVGLRDATGFAMVTASDVPLMWDADAGIRYVF